MSPFSFFFSFLVLFVSFVISFSPSLSLSFSLSLPHSWPLIESFRGKISNVLASFFCSFLFHVHLFNEVFFLAPMVPFFLLVPLSELGTKGECNFSSLRYFYDPLGTRVEKRPPILLSSLSHFHQPRSFSPAIHPLVFLVSFFFPPPFLPSLPFSPLSFFRLFFFFVLVLFSLQTVVVPVAITVLVVVDDKIHGITGVKRFMPRWATFISARRQLRLRSCLKETHPPFHLRPLVSTF